MHPSNGAKQPFCHWIYVSENFGIKKLRIKLILVIRRRQIVIEIFSGKFWWISNKMVTNWHPKTVATVSCQLCRVIFNDKWRLNSKKIKTVTFCGGTLPEATRGGVTVAQICQRRWRWRRAELTYRWAFATLKLTRCCSWLDRFSSFFYSNGFASSTTDSSLFVYKEWYICSSLTCGRYAYH